jgi:hypothetical protein
MITLKEEHNINELFNLLGFEKNEKNEKNEKKKKVSEGKK